MKILRQITYIRKADKGKTEDNHYDDLAALFKNSAENNNGVVAGQKWPITNNEGSTNTLAKTLCCQNLAKTVSDVEVDLEILN